MSEFSAVNAEISQAEHLSFVDELERLRPLLQNNVELDAILAMAESELSEDGRHQNTMTTISANFTVDNKIVTIAIDEGSMAIDWDVNRLTSNKRYSVCVQRPSLAQDKSIIFAAETYAVEINNFDDGEGERYSADYEFETVQSSAEGKWLGIPTEVGRIISEQLKLFDNGDISQGELNSAIRAAGVAKRQFENQVGVYGNRFTLQRFADIMTLLRSLQ